MDVTCTVLRQYEKRICLFDNVGMGKVNNNIKVISLKRWWKFEKCVWKYENWKLKKEKGGLGIGTYQAPEVTRSKVQTKCYEWTHRSFQFELESHFQGLLQVVPMTAGQYSVRVYMRRQHNCISLCICNTWSHVSSSYTYIYNRG